MKVTTRLLSMLLAATATALLVASCATQADNRSTSAPGSCVIVDNDFDIDDMMAIPLVIGNRYVAAVVQSEGYTLPRASAPAIDQLINQLPDQPGQRKIPVIVGGEQPRLVLNHNQN